jgi:hypothetical protein
VIGSRRATILSLASLPLPKRSLGCEEAVPVSPDQRAGKLTSQMDMVGQRPEWIRDQQEKLENTGRLVGRQERSKSKR